MADPSTFPYITPRAVKPSNDRSTRTKARAHVSTNPVSLPRCSELAAFQWRLYAIALTARPIVASMMINKAAIE